MVSPCEILPPTTRRSGRRAAAVLACLLLLAGLAYTALRPIDPAPYLATRPSGALLDREGAMLYAFLNPDASWCFPVSLDAISPHLIDATLATEDQRFYAHPGVDPVAALRALWQNLRGQRVSSGASTLTMQIVRLGGDYQRTWSWKLWQALAALRLERSTDKRALLAAYLNKAPYGLNLVGAEAAAQRYFGKPAIELTLGEAALLAGLPKAPTTNQPIRNAARAKARRDHVLARMRDEGYIDANACARAQAEAIGVAWHDFPQRAPHLAMQHREQLQRGDRISTTINSPLQASIEEATAKYLRRFDNDVTNAAVMLIDPSTNEVLARVASAGFFAQNAGRQVDICTAPRSPGSTLKPFTYGLAMQHGLLYPSERLLDDTLDFGAYSPGNFDGIYNGLISANNALQMSLNVPAVALLQRVGIDSMYVLLRNTGFTTLTESPEHYGLGLTLGNCGVRLDELAAAYAMLANLGEYRPLRCLASDPVGTPQRIFDPGIALTLYHMLEHPFPRENDKQYVGSSGVRTRVCWKTGTSTGFHDAWCVGFNQQYVCAVWVGNSDGRASQRLIGATAALPLVASLFRALPPRATPDFPARPEAEHRVEVCARTGLPATAWCQQRETVTLPKVLYLNRRCDVHHPSADGNSIVERWPGDARQWDLARVVNPVALESGSSGVDYARTQELRILAPVAGSQFVYTGEPGGDRVLLQSSIEGLAGVHWYLDGQFLGTSSGDNPLYLTLEVGPHQLSCLADDGTADSVRFEVLPAVDSALARTS